MRTEDGYIIHECLNEKPEAFGVLVGKYKAGIYAYVYAELRNFQDAQDVTQEVFLQAYRGLRSLRRWESFAFWLYRIARNLSRRWIRAESRRPDREFIEDQDPETLEDISINSYRKSQVNESLQEALCLLPESYREALMLYYFAGMSSLDIAKALGTSPTAVRHRLSRARAQLKEEMIAMMDTAFDEQRLQSSFTFRVMEIVKRMKIQPMPRTAGLPWGLSLATGIVLAILNFSPYPGILNRVATGSPLPGETKVLKTGEIPVDILRLSELPVLASKQGDSDGGEPESSDPRNAAMAVANDDEGAWTQESKEVIVDPKTGVECIKIKTFSGKNDVIQSFQNLSLSPNKKSLLWGKVVVPMDGGEPFDLVDMQTSLAVWSPDGRKVVLLSERAIWVVPVSPETGRATGPAKKLFDRGVFELCCWSPDSERIVIERLDEDAPGNVCILSVADGTLTQITNSPVKEWMPIWSPDGKTIAYLYGYQLRVIPAEGGTPRKLINEGIPEPVSWSPDSRWLIYKPLKFVNIMDERKFEIGPPGGRVGGFFGWSPGQSKMLSYKPSHDWRMALKIVSASGGPSIELGRQVASLRPYDQYWSSDSDMAIAEGGNKGESVYWVIPLSGEEPFPIELEVSVSGKLLPWRGPLYPSPDCKKLAFVAQRDDEKEDLYVVPISAKDGRSTGPAVMVFNGWDRKHYYPMAFKWSPDGKKIALTHEWNIWMAYADGSDPVQVTHRHGNTGHRVWPGWSPDGTMLTYTVSMSAKDQLIRVIPVSAMSESEDTIILDLPRKNYEWTPDSKSLLFFEEGTISAISIADGKSRQILDLKDVSVDSVGNNLINILTLPFSIRQMICIRNHTIGASGHRYVYANPEV